VQIVLDEKSKGSIVEKAVAALKKGGIVVYPSDTVYGIAVDATNIQAKSKLDHLKGRRLDQKYSYNFSNIDMIKKYHELSDDQEKILRKYLPGPFTFILSSDISVRIPKNCIITEIAQAYGKPVTATSANRTGEQPAGSTKSLNAKIYLAADLIIEDPLLEPHKPSTLVDISNKPYRVLREGELPFKD
jgi:L-threonylcarbamoyladenylate synthase